MAKKRKSIKKVPQNKSLELPGVSVERTRRGVKVTNSQGISVFISE